MNILYVSHNYESVQQHLYEDLKKVVTNIYLAYYPLSNSVSQCHNKSTDGVTRFNSIIKVKGFIFYKLYLQRISQKCIKYYKETPLDIVHGNMLFCDGYICRKIAKKKRIPYCISVRDTDINTRFLWKIPWLKRMGLKNIADAAAIFFLSPSYRDKLLKKVPPEYKEIITSKSYIVPNGIDEFYISNIYNKETLADKNKVRLIFVGKISKRKNLETTVAACEILKSRGIDAELKVVGTVVDREYEGLMRNTPCIEYCGKCEKEQVMEHLRNADIFVMPSHTETFGLVYLEAMTQGLPVIYTRGQGFDGQFKEGTVGFAVSDKSPEEIAEKVIAIMNNYEEMSRNASALSSKYSWGKVANRFVDIYRKITK